MIQVWSGTAWVEYEPWAAVDGEFVIADHFDVFQNGEFVLIWPEAPAGPSVYASSPSYESTPDRYKSTVSWGAVHTAETYEVQYRIDKGSGWESWVSAGTTNSLSKEVTGLSGQCQYAFRVRAGNEAGWGAGGTTVPVVTTSPQKLGPTITEVTPGDWIGGEYVRHFTVPAPKIGAVGPWIVSGGGVVRIGKYPDQHGYMAVKHNPDGSPTYRTVNYMSWEQAAYEEGWITPPVGAAATAAAKNLYYFSIAVPAAYAVEGTTYLYDSSMIDTVGHVNPTPNPSTTKVQPARPLPDPPEVTQQRFYSGKLNTWFIPEPEADSYTFVLKSAGGTTLQTVTDVLLSACVAVGGGVYRYPFTYASYADRSQYQVTVASENGAGTGTAHPALGLRRKLENPLVIDAGDSDTWYSTGWRLWDRIVQGNDQFGMNYAVFLYGGAIHSVFSNDYLGHRPSVSHFQLYTHRRANDGGPYNPSLVGIMLHTQSTKSTSFNPAGNGYGGRGYIYQDQSLALDLPNEWANYLGEEVNGWKGVGLYASETNLIDTGYGLFAPHYQQHSRHDYVIGSYHAGTLVITHDG